MPPLLALAAALLAIGGPAAAVDDGPIPPGTSSRILEGLRCSLVLPEGFDAAKEHSLVVVLHGNGGTETGMAGTLAHLASDDFAVVAPKSTGLGWDRKDVDAVRRIVAGLKKSLHVGEGRLHGIGFSNGGWNLAPLVFDEDLRFASACWVAAGYNGGSVPKAARRTMGVLALAGTEDGNRDVAEKTPDLLRDRVRSAECLLQPGLGHAWPEKLAPYLRWWLLVMEGRHVPGDCGAFDWAADPAAAQAEMTKRNTGGFAWYWSKDSAADPVAKAFQNETLRDPLVQRFGRQLVAWKEERSPAAEAAAAVALKETPAVVVREHDGRVVKILQGKFPASALGAALRSVAPDKTMPKR
jgi:predicted esterase